MGTTNQAIEDFVNACVADGIDDWIPPREVFVNAHRAAERSRSSTQEVLLSGLRTMILSGDFEVGEVVAEASGGLTYRPKAMTKAESLTYLQRYFASATDPDSFGFDFWLNLTDQGERSAAEGG